MIQSQFFEFLKAYGDVIKHYEEQNSKFLFNWTKKQEHQFFICCNFIHQLKKLIKKITAKYSEFLHVYYSKMPSTLSESDDLDTFEAQCIGAFGQCLLDIKELVNAEMHYESKLCARLQTLFDFDAKEILRPKVEALSVWAVKPPLLKPLSKRIF